MESHRFYQLLSLLFVIGSANSVLFVELKKFSRLGDKQYFIYSSSEARKSGRGVISNPNAEEVVPQQCSVGKLDGKVCQETVRKQSSRNCPNGTSAMKDSCIRFHAPHCPDNYKDISGKCVIDAKCNDKLYDQVGKKCHEKCTSGYRRYYSNLCITESKSCPIQFRLNGTQCILDECPIEMTLSEDQMSCENKCPKFFKKQNDTTCKGLVNVCPVNYERSGYTCIIRKCEYGLLMHEVCLNTVCPTSYEFKNNVCTKCLTSTHSYCSDMDWRCPMGMIQLGTGPHMQCVMICPRNYAQFGKHCYDISVTGCPENQYHFMGNQCIDEKHCPRGYKIFGKECVKESAVTSFIISGLKNLECPPTYIEFNGDCLKITKSECPEVMGRIEESSYCVESCPRGFKRVQNYCLNSNNCNPKQYSFIESCFDECPEGTTASSNTKSCQLTTKCDDEKVFDLTRFRCISSNRCTNGFFSSPDGKLCHKKNQCNGQGYILEQYCVSSCPLDYEVDTQFCIRKKRACPSLSLENGTCVSECPEGHVPKKRVCLLVKVEKKTRLCGVNKEMEACSAKDKDCVPQCVCKSGYLEDLEGDFCVPKETKCQFTHQLDLAFLIDGSKYINAEMFSDMKLFVMESITSIYTSSLDVRVSIYVYGQTDPQITLLYESKKLCDVMRKITKLDLGKRDNTYTSLIDAMKVSRKILMSQCTGARIGSTRQLFVIGEFSEFEEGKKSILSEIQKNQKAGFRMAFITIRNQIHLPESIYKFSVKSTKELALLQNQIFGITCKDFSCPKGYQKMGDNCIDVNECDSDLCHKSASCINVPGSYKCYCPNDLHYLGDEVGCGEKTGGKCTGKRNATQICDAVQCKAPANCSSSRGMAFCVCSKGFQYNPESGCRDIDECIQNPCLGNNARCRNSYGSFDCMCPKGFRYNVHFGCIDIDECIKANQCSGNGICQNLVGSYRCACHRGFEYILDQGCIDVNECNQTRNLCQGNMVICQNTPGSFRCVCPRGYEYKDKGCEDINECLSNNTCPEGSLCKNKVGGFVCACAKGFLYDNKTNTCELDKSLNVMKPTADLVFGVDASETMRLFMEPVVDMLKNIITDYKLKSLATIKHYFALSVGNMSDLHIVYTEETDKNVLKHTDEIRFMGGKALLSTGLEGSRKLYEHYAQTNSSKLVIFTTATRPDNYTSTEIRDIKKQITLIKKDARLLIIYVGDKVQSSEWLLVFKESEIEEHVIAVSTDFLTTIHKVIYQKTDRLIKCPDGFVFLDKVCQYKTSKARYCKWDSRLYALNSTWTSSCAIFNCTEKGVVVLETLCLGFDGDCYKENEFFPCNLNGKLNWRCKCHIVEYFEEETKQTQQRIDYIIINFNKSATIANTKLEDDGSCVLPFKYRNQWNYACTDHMSVKRWCSWNMYYVQSQYSYCARQVTSQCIFEGNTYKEGDKWSVGCNQVTCSTGTPFITARCPTLNGTCVPLNADNYPCKAGNDAYKSCMCLQDNFGYGENTAIQGKISQKKPSARSSSISSSTSFSHPDNNGGGDNNGLVEYCEHKTTGKQYQVGETWTIDCFDLICLDNGVTKIQSKNCASANGKCIAPGSAEKFSCRIGNRTRDNCECGLENDELVLIANEGGKAEKKVVNSKTIIEL